jgi:hypothetical protein
MPVLAQEQLTQLPPHERKYYSEMMARADDYSRQDYTPYAGNRIAGAPQEIEDIQSAVNRDFGAENGMLYSSENAIKRGIKPFHENYQQYMNPYQQAVVQALAEEGNRNFTENVLPALEARFVRLGQAGSSKHGDLALRATRDFQKELLSRQQQALASGYQQAGQMYNAQQLRELEGAGQLANLATTRQGTRLADVAALENVGRYKQQQQQALLDAQYQEYLRQLEHPAQRLSFQMGLMKGMPFQGINQAYYQTPTTPQMGLPQQFANLAGGILSGRMMGAFGGRS